MLITLEPFKNGIQWCFYLKFTFTAHLADLAVAMKTVSVSSSISQALVLMAIATVSFPATALDLVTAAPAMSNPQPDSLSDHLKSNNFMAQIPTPGPTVNPTANPTAIDTNNSSANELEPAKIFENEAPDLGVNSWQQVNPFQQLQSQPNQLQPSNTIPTFTPSSILVPQPPFSNRLPANGFPANSFPANNSTFNPNLQPVFTPFGNDPSNFPVFTPMGIPLTPPSPMATNVLPSEELLDAEYLLNGGDVLQLQFFNTPEFDGEYAIDPTGNLILPLIGRVSARGLTLQGLSDRLAEEYSVELRFPEVEVTLIGRRPLQVVLSGEIVQPGLYTLPAATNGQAPKLYQVLQGAGGLTAAANIEQVMVIRDSPDPSLSHAIAVNLLTLLQQGDITQNIELRDGDVVNILPAATLDVENVKTLALSTIRSQSQVPIDVAIVGEVGIPGPYRFNPGSETTMIQAIQQAGGLSPFADIRDITLERKTRSGTIQKITVDLFAILDSGRIDQDIALQSGDVIQIPIAELSNKEVSAIANSTLSTGPIEIAILGQVERPGGQVVPANTSLNQAILGAGGFNSRAAKKVKLLRFNPDGSVTERTIDVNLQRTINAEDNPILRSNDIVMVGKTTWGSIRDALSTFTDNLNFLLPFIFFTDNF